MVKKENPKIIARVDDVFYNRCVEKLSDSVTEVVFAGDTKLDKILLKDIFIVLGLFIQWLGRGIAIQFNPELLENETEFDTKILATLVDVEEVMQPEEFPTMVAVLGAFLEIAGREMPGPDLTSEEEPELEKEVVENESG